MLGFHVFAGSQNLSAEILCEAQRRTAELVVALAAHVPQPVRYVNLGGGFGIPYFDQDQPLDLPTVGQNLGDILAGTIRPALPDARVVIELGRYIVGECGVYVTRIVDRKVSRGQHVPRRRWRSPPSAGGERQLRSGVAPQLPGRDRQSHHGRDR